MVEQEYTPKDIVFVLDTSGSMAEEEDGEGARRILWNQKSPAAGSLQPHRLGEGGMETRMRRR